MSANQPTMSPVWEQPPAKPRMGCGTKLLIGLGIGFLLLILLCCGAGILMPFMVQSYASKSVSEDPAVVLAVTDEITQIDVPEQLRPKASFDFKIPIVGKRLMSGAVYADQQNTSVLILAALGEVFQQQDQAEIRQAIDQALQQQGIQREDMQIEESSLKELTIRGQSAVFSVGKGTSTESGKPRIQVIGTFEGETGPVMLILDADAEKFSEEEVIEMLESIE